MSQQGVTPCLLPDWDKPTEVRMCTTCKVMSYTHTLYN